MQIVRTAALLGCALTACARPIPDLAPSQLPEPAPDSVESVVFLVGDAGYADIARDPLLQVLAADVETWSARIARDSAVVVLYLGDIVYPVGLRPPTDPEWASDSAVVHSQVALVGGPEARRHGAIGYFIAGNHDWGNARNQEGVRRLRNLEEFLDRRRSEGIHVRLQPEAGEFGPAVIDIGEHTRLLLFDTAWWLLSQDEYRKIRAYDQTRDAIRSTGERNIIVAAHHPFETAGSHGGIIPLWRGLGIRYLLTKSGALLQDLSSLPYRELRSVLTDAFMQRRPVIFAGGHDHNLQVIDHEGHADWPRWSVVSGSASKTSDVGYTEGMRYRTDAPGYMRVVTYTSGRVDLFVIAADGDDESLFHCDDDGDALAECLASGIARFAVRHATRIW